ncbi:MULTISPECIES: carboxymuconolactone decarboxylase family protein [Oxalobacteraceae]|jgi:4-carboxymuconolactone decarboxylase|uniref:carboxymuconolactone decarboxylase family protein n=1 Tax=Oxalobacteraceae TaxID=75682 RepID=UPI002BB692AE|nr:MULTISPECIES: carboxymuconolactone decarboxylase family protein [Oxalobacteraceae]HTD05633.1 carboxymuconolactone decarboxylase family protein [Undibacterium sp.]HWW05488.1 carboxymuconolactone decarboxylase family protein [Collimonas sp.]
MTPSQKNADLLEKFAENAVEWGEREFRPVFPDLVDHLIQDIYGFAYRRGGIEIGVRHLISLGILAAMGDCTNQLRFQLRAGLNLGLTEEQIKEVFIQVAVFAGNARAVNAAQIFNDVLKVRVEEFNQSNAVKQ